MQVPTITKTQPTKMPQRRPRPSANGARKGTETTAPIFLPESPRWLVANCRSEQALRILTKYHGEGHDENVVVKIRNVGDAASDRT